MGTPKTIKIDDVEYAPVKPLNREGLTTVIIIVDNRGLTFVGDINLEKLNEPGHTKIHDARCIIRWGTSRHLAELINGPLPNTKIGHVAPVSFRNGNEVIYYEVQKGWAVK